MNAKTFVLSAICACLAFSTDASAQDFAERPAPVPQTNPAVVAVPASAMGSGVPGLSSWITNGQTCLSCLGPVGGNGPIGSQVYLRSGPSILTDGHYSDLVLNSGWVIDGGVKSLFYNLEQSAAWTVNVGLSNNNNRADVEAAPRFPTVINGTKAIVASMNRTYLNAGLGREWYLNGTACDPGFKWQIGVDGGGRYGSAYVTYTHFRHDEDVIGGVYFACFTDAEFPIFYDLYLLSFGLRAEYSYTWSSVFIRTSDLQDVNFLATVGLRY